MENIRAISFIPVLFIIIVCPFFVLAYSDNTTHPFLSREIIEFFNKHYGSLKISDSDGHNIIRGSVDEDRETRWLHHFYDPVKNRGLVLGEQTKTELASISGITGSEWSSSKTWANDTISQAGGLAGLTAGVLSSYFSSEKDFSWDRAIYEYAWGDKERGLISLGHVLHLIQDATVPDHTRNDPHPPVFNSGSPYEDWARRFDIASSDITEQFLISGYKPVLFENINRYFESVARYSNNNFFSKDSIGSKNYSGPIVVKFNEELSRSGSKRRFGYALDENGEYYHLVFVPAGGIYWKGDATQVLSLEDPDNRILNDYWFRLSRQAILHGAGVVKLFFDEVENEKQTKTLFNKNKSWLAKASEKIEAEVKQALGAAKSAVGSASAAAKDWAVGAGKTLADLPNSFLQFRAENKLGPEAASLISALSSPSEPSLAEAVPSPTSARNEDPPAAPGPAGVGIDLPALISSPTSEPATSEPQQDNAAEKSAADAPAVILLATSSPQTSNPLQSPDSSPVDAAGTGLPPEPQQPPAPRGGPDNSSSDSPTAAVAAPPDISLEVEQCLWSISEDSCLLIEAPLTVIWVSSAANVDHYALECFKNGAPCLGFVYNPTATSTQLLADDGAIYTFKARAVDALGYASELAEKEVEVNSKPVVINEIAWAGTAASTTQDEWIELYNRSSKSVALSGFTLLSLTDQKPNINLSGTIPPRGFFLIERTDDNTVSDVAASQMAPFGSGSGSGAGLSDGGEVLALNFASTTVDQTPPLGACGLNVWCGGNRASRQTMERIDYNLPGADPAAWGDNDIRLRNGRSVDGVAINGTPKARNSLNYYIAPGSQLMASRTLAKANSPYVVGYSTVTINPGVTLSIEPGVVIKFLADDQNLIVDGTLKAIGTAGENIIFTSFHDDEFGGDTNGDGGATLPAPGNWRAVIFESSSRDSELAFVRARYGGRRHFGRNISDALVEIEGASVSIADSIFEKSYQNGLRLADTGSRVVNSLARGNNRDDAACGIAAEGGNPEIRGNVFENNNWGLCLRDSTRAVVSGNNFRGNVKGAANLGGSFAVFSSNQAAANGVNGIVTNGYFYEDYTFTKDLPYVVGNELRFLRDKVITVRPGVVFKAEGYITVEGLLKVQGSASEPVIFTSLQDDEYGGDTNNDGAASTPRAGDWAAISFAPTATSSTIDYAIARYGGAVSNGIITVNSSRVDISNSVIEKSGYQGLHFIGGDAELRGLTVRDNDGPNLAGGIYLENGARVFIADSIFRNNKFGIAADGGAVLIGGGGVDIDGSNQARTLPPDLLP